MANEWVTATSVFLELIEIDPSQPRYYFQAGQALFHTRQVTQSLPYFEKSKSLGYEATALNLYLGKTLHYGLRLEEAVTYYTLYKTALTEDEKEELGTVDRLIENCRIGRQLIDNEISLEIVSAGSTINSPFPEFVPVLSADESIMYFTSQRVVGKVKVVDDMGMPYEDIYKSEKDSSGNWLVPVRLGSPLNSKFHNACIGLSPDGQKMLLYHTADGGDIYMSDLKNGLWSKPYKVEGDVNSSGWEGSASFSSDEQYLYFSSDRAGGLGGSDLYVSKKNNIGIWSKAINMGPVINTPYDEDAPQIHTDGKTMFFSSKGHRGMGGYDIFSSIFDDADSSWSTPRNIGYPINTADDDIYFTLAANGSKAYFSSIRPEGLGHQDIYIMYRPQASSKMFLFRGKVFDERRNQPIPAVLTLSDFKLQEVTKVTSTDLKTGNYSFEMEFDKDYTITIEADGFFFHNEKVNIGKQASVFEYVMDFIVKDESPIVIDLQQRQDTALVQKQVRELKIIEMGGKIVLQNLFFDFNKSILKYESKTELETLYDLLEKYKDLEVEISGHTDDVGRSNYNKKLSEKRAAAVYTYLVEKGIDKKRMQKVGYGEAKPIMSNLTAEGRKMNRRTELEIIRAGGGESALLAANTAAIKSKQSLPLEVWQQLPISVHFLYNDGKFITEYSKNKIKDLLKLLAENPTVSIAIMGYEDLESEDKEKKLGDLRAKTVLQYLEKQGIPQARMIITPDTGLDKTHGEKRGIQRRKVAFFIVSK